MRALLKKYFVPAEENDFKPRILHKNSVLLNLIFILLLETSFFFYVSFILPQTSLLAQIFPKVLIDFTNEVRASNTVAPLKPNAYLERAAQEKAEDMAKRGYFSHVSPDGKNPWYWFNKAGYNYAFAGENLAIHFFDSQDLMEAWMESPSHRSNILNKNFTEIGIGVAQGYFAGKETVYIVQFFGKPLSKVTTTPTLETKEIKPKETGTETQKVQPTQITPEMFAANNNVSPEEIPSEEKQIPKEEVLKISFESSPIQRVLSAPKFTIQYLLLFLFLLFTFALFLNIFITIRIQHLSLIAGGVFLLSLLTLSILLNNYLFLSQSKII